MLSSSTLFSYTTLFRSLFLVFYIRCAVRVEGRHGFHPPSLPFGAFCLRPVDHRLVRIQDQSGAGVSEFNAVRSEEHTSELQSRGHLVCRLLLEKKKQQK